MLVDLPILALGTVLFPGGVLPLRVFEARYMDMVRDCLARETPFGVCLITSGSEVGEAAEHEAVGCTATIAGWDMPQLGVLHLRTIGRQRFRVVERRVQRDGLVRVDAEPIAEDRAAPVPDEFAACAALLRRIVEELVEREGDPTKRMIASPYAFDSASWVSNRLCEFVPLAPAARQRLMALDDPVMRLSRVHQFLQQHQVL